ncbi:hypothetical protein LWC33_04325 [Pseudonocardia sp. RS11V-5]|nr:hypothetical protein [Pseudonocardia terrae]MCE3550680.1 hypothetical protein [Pseudonocardia terrae]
MARRVVRVVPVAADLALAVLLDAGGDDRGNIDLATTVRDLAHRVTA